MIPRPGKYIHCAYYSSVISLVTYYTWFISLFRCLDVSIAHAVPKITLILTVVNVYNYGI